MEFEPLPIDFYEPSAAEVAPALLGHFLLRFTASGPVGGLIVETEAYIRNDPACHADRGKTKRTEVIFGPPGRSYVYLIYGFYHCFNAVCLPEGLAEAVLIRAIEPMWGLETMRQLRRSQNDLQLTSGPGKLCVAMGINRSHNALNLADRQSEIIMGRNPDLDESRQRLGPMITTTRIGINVAADLPLRFYLDGSAHVSRKMPALRKKK
ncbi:MAG: DNA-3-methyladenine glycosylase [Verrucomicrobiales bacterium]